VILYALLFNTDGTWSVLAIDGELVTALSTHASKLEAEQALTR
jgi:hypothetical protein